MCGNCFLLKTRYTFNGPEATVTQQHFCNPCRLDIFIKYISTLYRNSKEVGWLINNEVYIPHYLVNPAGLSQILKVDNIDPIIDYINWSVKLYKGDNLKKKLTVENVLKSTQLQ